MKQLESIELFSGAGGLALGLHTAGFHHRALYEWNASHSGQVSHFNIFPSDFHFLTRFE